MLVLHAHWKPPLTPADPGGVLFWAETSEGNPPAWQHGRLPNNSKLKEHPFCAPLSPLRQILGSGGEDAFLTLRLPTTRTGPQPSPDLVHDWSLDRELQPALAPWKIRGIWLEPAEAFQALLDLPGRASAAVPAGTGVKGENGDTNGPHTFRLAADARYWHLVAALALEIMAAQKLVPLLVPVDATGKLYHARWLPVQDGPKDGPRLKQVEAAMPPVCRAEALDGTEPPAPRVLVNTFLSTVCDALMRQWGKFVASRITRQDVDTARRWLGALFRDDPTVEAFPAQLQALATSLRAWLRNLHVAGDDTYRIAFRLEAPQGRHSYRSPAWQLHYLLQARDDPSLLIPAEIVWNTSGSVLNFANHHFEQPQEKLLAGLGFAARLFPRLAENLKSKRPTQVNLDSRSAYTFLREVAPLLEGAGFGLLVPPWWNKPSARLGVRLRMKPAAPQQEWSQNSRLSLTELVSYRWELSVGETSLTQEEFKALVALKSPLVLIRGQWVQLDPEQVEAAIKFWENQQTEGEMSLLEALQLGVGDPALDSGLPVREIVTEGWLTDWLERFHQPERMSELPQPASLKGELRPYQRFGFSWLHFHRRWGLGACLADDMGLGKTIQTLALLLNEKETHGKLAAPVLLVCPTSVVTNWEREIRRFAPSLTTLIHQGANRLRGDEFSAGAQKVDMVLTSYALVRQDAELLQATQWLGVILDEAQNIKNPVTKQAQSVRRLSAEFRLALTGTPVENRLTELWSIMHFLNPGYLGPQEKFRREFALPIERYNDKDALQRLKQLSGPFILRRVKTDPRVIQDLPEKVETQVYCNLTEEQATLYEAVVRDAMGQIENKEGIQRQGLVLSMLMQLKQICNHPVHYLHESKETAPEVLRLAGRSGKLERLTELLEEVLAEGDRALIFTQFAEMGKLLAGYLPQALGEPVLYLHGGTPVKARDQMVQRFQEDEHAPPIFILSLKAGGTGLNLMRANHVFHFDRWWNPAVENQATDRAYRIGQVHNVQVHKFVTVGTMEEMVDEMIESKKGLADSVVGSGEHWLTELSTDELRELVSLRK